MESRITTTCRCQLEQLEQRRMLSADLSAAYTQPREGLALTLDVSSGQVSADEQAPFAGAAARTQVPFKGSLEGVVTITPLVPPFVSVLVDATGNATHLGQFTLAIPHIVNRATRTAIGSYRFVAANGDTLSADFTGQSTPTATPGVLSIAETAIITGGTGRFAGATGGFICERLFDTVASTTTGSFRGTISSPGAASTSVAQTDPAPIGLSPDRIVSQQSDSAVSFGSADAREDQMVVAQVLE